MGSKNDDKTIKNRRTYSDTLSGSFSPHTVFVPLHTGLLEKYEFQIISVTKQKLQKITAEILSLVGVLRKNGNTAGTFFNMLEKVVQKESF